ncbi:hypothetical protein [Brevundimonas naejangsanensis]|uniref:hypothetical protein n=1 Tax=Brevundimonas naejangsanensis TaxID=588932 RepID=UPI00320A64F7
MILTLALTLALSAETEPQRSLYPLVRLHEYIPPITSTTKVEGAFDYVTAGTEDYLIHTPPQVAFWAQQDMHPISLSVAFNWTWMGKEENRRPFWVARLRAAVNGRIIERFADARTCPGIEQSLDQIANLPPVTPKVPVLPDPDTVSQVDFGGYLHDNTYRITMRGVPAGSVYSDELAMTGGSASPLAPVVVESLARLLPCWTEGPPPSWG